MDAITLGTNGPVVKPLGIGAWSWGDKLFWSYGKDYGEQDVRQAFDAAVEAGVTFFDTAEVYGPGESERLLGRFMQQCDRPIQIATKYAPYPWRLTKGAVAKALSASLERLQCDRVALYQVHWPFALLMGQDTLMNALADEVERGRIEAIGVSNYSAKQMRKAHDILARRGIPLAVNQVRYSLLARKIEQIGILDTARELGVTILAYSPLAQGLLTGKYQSDRIPSGARQFDARFKQADTLQPVLSLLREIGENHQRTPAQVALNWLIVRGGTIPIPGAKNAAQARDNAGALGWRMSSEEFDRLDKATQPYLSNSNQLVT
jgi:aryl-alcohol dehydrogenase-like predicted oxidoreductase